MKITDIVPKRKRLSAIYIDGEYALKVDTETVLTSRFKVGSEITDEELKELIDEGEEKRAKEKALWLLSNRDHSRRELETKIRRTSDPQSARKAAERMEELGLVDDEKYARRLAQQLFYGKHLSERGVRQKLIEKGLERELVDEVLEEFDLDPREQIEELLETKYARSLSDEKGRRRTIAALQRMGFSWSDIKACLSNYCEEDFI